ncbi:1266_t:CDS:2, partial [Paraglomus occultum]
NTIMSNSNLHALSLPKSVMDTIQGLEIHLKDGNGEQNRMRYYNKFLLSYKRNNQFHFPTNPNRLLEPKIIMAYRTTTTIATVLCMGCPPLSLHDKLPVQKYPECAQPQSTCHGNQTRARSSKHIQNISHSSHQTAEETLDHNPTREQSLLLPLRLEWDNYSKNRNLGVQELCRNKFMDLSISMEARSSDQISHNIHADSKSEDTMQELQDLLEKLKNDP